MINSLERVEIEFLKWDGTEMILKKHVAETRKELNELLELYYSKYSGEGYKLIRTNVRKCDCGEEVNCDRFTNTCVCGADYNMNGERLAPRSQWGEETGEHWSEIY